MLSCDTFVAKAERFGDGTYALIVAALRARRFDLVAVAANGKAIEQNALHAAFLNAPTDDIAHDLQVGTEYLCAQRPALSPTISASATL